MSDVDESYTALKSAIIDLLKSFRPSVMTGEEIKEWQTQYKFLKENNTEHFKQILDSQIEAVKKTIPQFPADSLISVVNEIEFDSKSEPTPTKAEPTIVNADTGKPEPKNLMAAAPSNEDELLTICRDYSITPTQLRLILEDLMAIQNIMTQNE